MERWVTQCENREPGCGVAVIETGVLSGCALGRADIVDRQGPPDGPAIDPGRGETSGDGERRVQDPLASDRSRTSPAVPSEQRPFGVPVNA